MSRDLIYSKTVGNRTFIAEFGYRGVMISEKKPKILRSGATGRAEISNATLKYLDENACRMGTSRNRVGYHLCRYDDENVVDLSKLNEAEIVDFAACFGVPLVKKDDYHYHSFTDAFVDSPCHIALKEWVNKHPKLATRSNCTSFTGNARTLKEISEWVK
ncbi:hypothetical protein [Moritella sp. F3]|uniref:hypothetical protein n=1 Tax=Moritella sp. F3 TaxID=2718882 RepID=UPI0018E1BDB6|nr:hypothetical protein [Moritella sp. F3]GIC77162.1 hypothetical protein FMO001_18890 [Moritella sp. F1]GIC82281.1 hypothetical protein FMO003_25620 [Moritella sp. F3]